MSKKFPPEFRGIIDDLLGEEAPLFWEAMQTKPTQGLRINPLKTNLLEIQSALGGNYTPLPWSNSGYQLHTDHQAGIHPFHGAGLYYLQEPSAMAPVALLDPQPGEQVLDLCAAPGGKTTQIAARMKGHGFLTANDPNPHRIQALSRNLERWGARNTAVLRETPRRLAEHFGAYFDRVLVDAPCSGEGTFRAKPGEIKKWSPAFSQRSAVLQDEILWYAGKLVKPGGVLVYATCTFNQDENEAAIARFLEHNPDFELDKNSQLEGISPGIAIEDGGEVDFSQAVRLWPHRSSGEGHFAARLKKSSSPTANRRINPYRPPLSGPEYKEFFNHTLRETENLTPILPSSKQISVYGSRLYWVPDHAPPLEGLSVVHWGWWLGTIQADQFIPGPALASAIHTEDAQKVLEFSLGDPQLLKYLRGSPATIQTLDPGAAGWVLVAVEDHPLGWGKIQGNRLKSCYPRWLRSH